jgi:biopolymer transport protein TolQ
VLSSVRKFEAHFWGGNTLEVLYEQFGKKPKTTIERVFSSGINEWHKTIHMGSSAFTANKVVSVRERLERSMNISITREIHTLGER